MGSPSMRVLCTGASGFIGTHLADRFIASGMDFINVDIAQPKRPTHFAYWHECNILDAARLEAIFTDYHPTHVIHLAARAMTKGKTIHDFRDNTEGTASVLAATKCTPGISRVIVTSSQHVRKPGSGLPKHDQDFVPHGLYGESKVIAEQLTRRAELSCVWTIIRPTTVWGCHHPFLPGGLWKVMKRGLYFHPSNDPVVRSYGYVRNVAWEIEKLLSAPEAAVNGRVYYLGEQPIMQIEWINAFSRALTGRDVSLVPKELIRALALVGDAAGYAGMNFPMDSQRYFNLTTTNPVPITPAIETLGVPPYSLREGIEETVSWLEKEAYA